MVGAERFRVKAVGPGEKHQKHPETSSSGAETKSPFASLLPNTLPASHSDKRGAWASPQPCPPVRTAPCHRWGSHLLFPRENAIPSPPWPLPISHTTGTRGHGAAIGMAWLPPAPHPVLPQALHPRSWPHSQPPISPTASPSSSSSLCPQTLTPSRGLLPILQTLPWPLLQVHLLSVLEAQLLPQLSIQTPVQKPRRLKTSPRPSLFLPGPPRPPVCYV
jgi:hypothetical protein